MQRLARAGVTAGAVVSLVTTATFTLPGATAAADPPSTVRPGGRTVYVTNSANSGGSANVARFAVSNTGALTPVDTVEVGDEAGARSMVFTPDRQFAYLANTLINQVVMFRIGPDGALTRFGGVETPGPFAMAINPDGRTVYVTNAGTRTLSVFGVRDGQLTPHDVVDTGAEASKGVAVTPDARFLYVTHGSPGDTKRTVMTGFALRPDGSVSDKIAQVKIGISGAETVITPNGRFIYAVNQGSNDVHGFRIGTLGGLTPVPNSPVDGGDFPEGAAISPDGRRIYVAAVGVEGQDPDALAGQVLGFTIGRDGRLTENIDRVEMASPIGIGFTPDRRMHVSDFTDSIVNTFAIASDGNMKLTQTVKSAGPRPAFHSVNVPPATTE